MWRDGAHALLWCYYRALPLPRPSKDATRKRLPPPGGDDDYGDAFKKAKPEHDQRSQADTEAKRLQAEADADTAVLSNVVLPQLQAAD